MASKRGNNEGSIYKRSNGTWRAQISLEEKRLSFTSNSRAECHEWLRKTMILIDRGMTLQNRNATLEEFLMEWYEVKKTTIKSKTAYDYERIVFKNIIPFLGKVKLKDLNTHQITRFYTKHHEMDRGIRTIHYIHSVLRMALQHAVKTGVMDRNPCIGALLPRKEENEMQVLTENQVTQFLISAEESRYKALYHLAITTGMRYGELTGLKWTDIDWERGTIRIQRQLQYVPRKGFQFNRPKTRNSIRTIILGESTLQVLREHYQKFAHQDRTGENLIFTNGIGTLIYFKRFYKDFKRILESAKLPDIRFHDLRHTAATLMISNGIPAVIVSKILGHANPSITMNIYAHVSIEMQSEAAKLMENLVTPIPVNLDADFKEENIKNPLHPVAPDSKNSV